MAKSYVATDEEFVKGNTPSIAKTMTNKSTGAAVNVASWDIYFKAKAVGSHTTDIIVVAPGSVVKSSSGSGVTDTFTIPFSSSDTDVDVGKYNYEILRVIGTDEISIVRGTLTITDNIAEAS